MGTSGFLPPSLVYEEGVPLNSRNLDMFAFGITLVEMFTGNCYFTSKEGSDVYFRLQERLRGHFNVPKDWKDSYYGTYNRMNHEILDRGKRLMKQCSNPILQARLIAFLLSLIALTHPFDYFFRPSASNVLEMLQIHALPPLSTWSFRPFDVTRTMVAYLRDVNPKTGRSWKWKKDAGLPLDLSFRTQEGMGPAESMRVKKETDSIQTLSNISI